MEESAVAKPRRRRAAAANSTTTTVATPDRPTPEPGGGVEAGVEDVGLEGEGCDAEAWEMLTASFKRVQSVLDRNRALISQVNENHQSKVPDNIAKNVALISEINGNISKVLSIYSDLSIDFSEVVHKRRALQNAAGGRNGEKLESSGA